MSCEVCKTQEPSECLCVYEGASYGEEMPREC